MNEPPGARARVALTGLTMAEYFRDEEGQDVLLFVDNIFRFTQAGAEVSALLGRIPLPSDISRLWASDGQLAGAGSLRRKRVQSLRFKRFTFRLMITLIQRRLRRSPTWTRQLTWIAILTKAIYTRRALPELDFSHS